MLQFLLFLHFLLPATTTTAATAAAATATTTRQLHGVLNLDRWSFDKVLTGRYPTIVYFPSSNFSTSIQKNAEQAWSKLIRGTHTINGIVFGHIPHHPPLNQQLRDRFHLSDSDLPAFLFFSKFESSITKNDPAEPSSNPEVHKYDSSTVVGRHTAKALGDFVRQHTKDVWIGQQGCSEYFDKLALQLRSKAISSKIVLRRAAAALASARDYGSIVQLHDKAHADAEYYVELFQRYTTQPGFILRESLRLKKRKSAAPREKRHEYLRKLNILTCFNGGEVVAEMDERRRASEEEQDKYYLKTGRIMGFGKDGNRVRDISGGKSGDL